MMFDLRILKTGLLASSTLVLGAPIIPGSCSGTGLGTGGSAGQPPIVCGNGVIDPGEDCDIRAFKSGSDLCTSVSDVYTRGTLFCTSDCRLDTGACGQGVCGNGVVEPGESCDGKAFSPDMTTLACAEVLGGYIGGQVKCDSQCHLDASDCIRAVCGNGVIETGESCEGNNLAGHQCTEFSGGVLISGANVKYAGGQLACNSVCGFDVSGCVHQPGCYLVYGLRSIAGIVCY